MTRSGAELALLLLGGYRRMVEDVMADLSARGYGDVRPAHDFTMRAIDAGADSASDLARRMSISKQGAAKTVELLIERGFVARDADPADARRKKLSVTPLGHEVMRVGESLFDARREKLRDEIGAEGLDALESGLRALVADSDVRPDSPGWVAQE